MFLLAVVFFSGVIPWFPARPEYFLGLIFIGMARCIAMVLVWNDLADGSSEYAAGLVAFNSVFQIVTYGVYIWFFALFLPPVIGLDAMVAGIDVFDVTIEQVFWAIAIFLGLPFTGGIVTRLGGIHAKGEEWYEETLAPTISPITLLALLFTVVVMFATQGDTILAQPLDVVWLAVPLTIYFVVMFLVSFGMGRGIGADYSRRPTHRGARPARVSTRRRLLSRAIRLDRVRHGRTCERTTLRQRTRGVQRRRQTPTRITHTTDEFRRDFVFAEQCDATLRVVSVADSSIATVAGHADDSPSIRESLRKQPAKRAEVLRAEAVNRGLRATALIREGVSRSTHYLSRKPCEIQRVGSARRQRLSHD